MSDPASAEPFWADHPLVLFENFEIVPREGMSVEARLNAITRLVILIFLILLVCRYKHALTFLLAALLLIMLMHGFHKARTQTSRVQRDRSPSRRHQREMDSPEDEYYSPERFYTRAGNGSPGGEDDAHEVSAKNKSTNPRKPYPPTIPHDFVVKSGYGQVLNSDPLFQPYVKPFEQPVARQVKTQAEPVQSKILAREDPELLQKRAETRKKAFGGGPRVNYKLPTAAARYHGYQPQDFEDFEVNAENEAEEESDVDSEPDIVVEAPSLPAKPAIREKVELAVPGEKPKKRFLPSNYDAAFEQPAKETVVRSERARPKAHGMGRNARLNLSESDSTRSTRKYNHDDLLFGKAVKSEQAARTQAQTNRLSQRNTLFSN